MTRILLGRDVESGIEQIDDMRASLITGFGIIPKFWRGTVGVSEYRRSQETAKELGFRATHILPLFNDAEIDSGMTDQDVIAKHVAERWAPEEALERADRIFEHIRAGKINLEIIIAHGMINSALMLRLESDYLEHGEPFPYVFDDERGFVARHGTLQIVDVLT